MKWNSFTYEGKPIPSLPVRGAWIEISTALMVRARCKSLPVRGAWIEICRTFLSSAVVCCRSPCGERGLKFAGLFYRPRSSASLPVRGAWIEIQRQN